MDFEVGISRQIITPPWEVELAGLGYFLERTWERIRDDLTATALVVTDNEGGAAAVVAVDMMYNDARFTQRVRERVAAHTRLKPDSVCVSFSHSHNAPTAGSILGAGEVDSQYLEFAARKVATAVIMAWHKRGLARIYAGWTHLAEISYNRTRENGPVDTRVNVLRIDGADGRTVAVAVNFHAQPCVHMDEDYRAVSRDVPGEVVDQLEAILPGTTAMYLQGTAGDVNFNTQRSPMERRQAPTQALTGASLKALALARPVEKSGVSAASAFITLPTRRWKRKEEVMHDREEGLYRLKTGDTTGWLDGIARAVVNDPKRLSDRYDGSEKRACAAVARFAVEWTDRILPELDTRPESLDTEVYAIRVGDVYFAAHPAELFSTLGLDLRRRWPSDDLFMLGYSNGRVGYLPDEHDIERRSYGAYTSPKCTGQFPFTAESGPALIKGLVDVLHKTES